MVWKRTCFNLLGAITSPPSTVPGTSVSHGRPATHSIPNTGLLSLRLPVTPPSQHDPETREKNKNDAIRVESGRPGESSEDSTASAVRVSAALLARARANERAARRAGPVEAPSRISCNLQRANIT